MKYDKRILKGLQHYSDYIDDHSKVEGILNKKDFDLSYTGLRDKQYNYELSINGVKFKYFEGIGNDIITDENEGEKIINALWCLLCDEYYYDYDVNQLCDELGYQRSMANEVLKAIKKNHDKLLKVFTEDEIQTLKDNIQL